MRTPPLINGRKVEIPAPCSDTPTSPFVIAHGPGIPHQLHAQIKIILTFHPLSILILGPIGMTVRRFRNVDVEIVYGFLKVFLEAHDGDPSEHVVMTVFVIDRGNAQARG